MLVNENKIWKHPYRTPINYILKLNANATAHLQYFQLGKMWLKRQEGYMNTTLLAKGAFRTEQ